MKRKPQYPRTGPLAQAHTPEANATRSLQKNLVISAGLAAITLIIYWPVMGFDFVNYDDPRYVTTNLHVLGGLTWTNICWAFRTGYAGNWHPLTWISLMLNVQLSGAGAGGLHLVNLLFHVANTVLLFLLLNRWTRACWRSAWVAALFALHPLHVESVAWISERKDVLSVFFALLALLAYGAYAEKSRAFWTSRNYWLAILFFALGLMSKPMLVTLPFLLLLLDYWPLRRWGIGSATGRAAGFARLIPEKIPFLLLSATGCIITVIVQKNGGMVQTLNAFPMGSRIENAFVAYARYLGETFWPGNLSVYYPYPAHWPWLWIILAVILMGGLCLGAWWFGRRVPFVLTGWFWFLGMMIPVIGLVQAGDQSLADRYTYLPLVGLFIIFAWGADEIFARWHLPKAVMGILATAITVAFTMQTANQLRWWHDSQSLMRHAIAVTGPNYLAQNNLGDALLKSGEIGEAITHFKIALEIQPDCVTACDNLGEAALEENQPDEALAYFTRAVEMDPDYAVPQNNLANLLARKGQLTSAIEHYRKALATDPGNAEIHYNLANALLGNGQSSEAVTQFEAAVGINPQLVEAQRKLGVLLAQNGQVDDAIIHFQKAVEIQPDDADTQNNFAGALFQKGRLDEAVIHYQKALALNPGSVAIQNNFARLVLELATSPTSTIRNGARAIELAQQANRLSGGKNPALLGALAAAYAETGKFPEATAVTQLAIQMATAQDNTNLVADLQVQFKNYSAHGTTRERDTNVSIPARRP